MIASDVSAPSLEKARRLLASRGLADRVRFAVADGLAALDGQEEVQAVIITGMGAGTILQIVGEGRALIGGAALIVQANVICPPCAKGLRAGFFHRREVFAEAAGRHYVTLMARRGTAHIPDARCALLGTAAGGVCEEGQRSYFLWQRDVRVRGMEKASRCPLGERAGENAALQPGIDVDFGGAECETVYGIGCGNACGRNRAL